MKYGAMFGLDARIALVIFGALSVISGAALYSAIQQAKTVQYNQQFQEIIKASEAYLLDVGENMPVAAASLDLSLNAGDLAENSLNKPGWSGPYLSNIARVANAHFTYETNGVKPWTTFKLRKVTTWPGSTAYCVSGENECAEFVHFHLDDDDERTWGADVFTKLDEYIDNNDGMLAGKVRKIELDANNHYLYYQGRIRNY